MRVRVIVVGSVVMTVQNYEKVKKKPESTQRRQSFIKLYKVIESKVVSLFQDYLASLGIKV